MSDILEALRGVGIPGIILRLVLSILCGGVIGLERETKRRAAGFRTHTLICIGASLTTMTGLYLVSQNLPTDPSRLGAQVIAGMSFIGAGAIIVTSRRQVKGLTTAAGLWTSAIIGLAIGSGYYEAALIATLLVLFAEIFLAKFEYYLVSSARTMNVSVEVTDAVVLDKIVGMLTEHEITVSDLEYTHVMTAEGKMPCGILSVKFRKKMSHEKIMTIIAEIPGVRNVEEL